MPDGGVHCLWLGFVCLFLAPPPPPKLSYRCTPQRAQVSAGVGKPPHGLGVCIWMHLVNGTGNSPSPARPTPGVVKQDKSSGGSVDTTKTRSDPQRVRMSSGERPIGAVKGKQSDTEALCQPPPPPTRPGGGRPPPPHRDAHGQHLDVTCHSAPPPPQSPTDCGVHYLWFAFVCFLIRSHPPQSPAL